MGKLPDNLNQKLSQRKSNNSLRRLQGPIHQVDFSSNDYLGFSKSKTIFNNAHQYLIDQGIMENGATGSRLLSGNHKLYFRLESYLCEYHNSKAALIFNSGYDANLGFFSSVPQREDVILFDELVHASIRDGIRLSLAKSYKFKHNDLLDLEHLIHRHKKDQTIYVVTESVFSMDGDSPDLVGLTSLCNDHNCLLIVDEAHAVGVVGNNGSGLIAKLGLEDAVFARLITFGKALGCHGAAILCDDSLKTYLINFARSFIYTTALPPHSLSTIYASYQELMHNSTIQKLEQNVVLFRSELKKRALSQHFINSDSAIQSCIVSGNENVKSIAQVLAEKGFEIKPILSPTVPEGQERLRFCLHAFNTKDEIVNVLEILATIIPNEQHI